MPDMIDYDKRLDINQARDAYEQARSTFAEIQGHYTGIVACVSRQINEEDNKTLVSCVHNLLALHIVAPIREEVDQILAQKGYADTRKWDKSDPDFREAYESTLEQKAPVLLSQILEYLSKFQNTGIRKLSGNPFLH